MVNYHFRLARIGVDVVRFRRVVVRVRPNAEFDDNTAPIRA